MCRKSQFSRRDFLKLTCVGAATTAILTACGPGSADQNKLPSELTPLGQLKSPPFYMVDGEPRPMSIDEMNSINTRLATVNVPKYGYGVPLPEQAVVNKWGNWTITKVPDSTGNSTIITSGPTDLNIIKNHTLTAGLFDISKLEQKTVIDTTKTPGTNAVLTTSEMNLKRFLNEKELDEASKEVSELFKYGSRTVISSETEEIMNLPGNAFFIHTLANSLNRIEFVISNKLFNQGNSDMNSWALEVEKARGNFLEKFFSLSPEEMMVPEARTETTTRVRNELATIFASDDSPEKFIEAQGLIDYLFVTMSSFKRKIDFIRSPEAAMSIIKSMNMIGELLHYPNEPKEVREQKDRKVKAFEWLAQNDGLGIWNTEDSYDIDQGKKDFWIDLPEVKPRALNVVKLKTDIKTDDNGKIIETRNTYRTEVVLLYPSSGIKSIYKVEKSDELPENPLSTEIISTLTQPETKITEEDLKKQGYTLDSKDEPEWKVLDISEINNRFVRLHYIPEDKVGLHWTIPLEKNSQQREALTASINLSEGLWNDIKMLFHGGDSYNFQSLLLDTGKNKGDIYENRPFTWAQDVTDLWKKNISQGVRKVTSLGLISPQDLLAKTQTGLYIPKEEGLQDIASGWFYQSIVEGQNLPVAWGSVTTDNPVYVFDITTGNIVTSYSKGDFFHFYHLDWLDTANGRMPMLVISPDNHYGIPLDQNNLQLINTGVQETSKKFLYQYIPWIATAFLAGPKLLKVGGSILGFLGGLFSGA